MREGQIGIRGSGEIQFGNGFVNFFAVEISLAENEVKLGSLAADFEQATKSFLVQVIFAGIVSGDAENVEVGEVVGHLRPKGLKRRNGVVVMLGENMAETEKVARLRGLGLIANDGGQRSDGAGIITAAVLDEADIEADAGHFRGQLFGFLEKCES